VSAETVPTVVFQSATPQFTVPDVIRAAEYYRDVFGFEIAGYWDGARVTFRAEGACDVYIDVTGVDALAGELRRRGADVLDGPEDRVYKQRELVVRDCNGLVLVFAEDTSGRADLKREGDGIP
jgi:uncharacterized glyoxalase superfamily protein PhnB